MRYFYLLKGEKQLTFLACLEVVQSRGFQKRAVNKSNKEEKGNDEIVLPAELQPIEWEPVKKNFFYPFFSFLQN